jgi:hypothetical protein
VFATALNAQRLSDRHLRLSFASGAAMAAVVRDLAAQKKRVLLVLRVDRLYRR